MKADKAKYEALVSQIDKTKEDLAKAELYPGDANYLNQRLTDTAKSLEDSYKLHQSHDQVYQAIAQCEATMQALIEDMNYYINETNMVKDDILTANQQVNKLQIDITAAVSNYSLFQEDKRLLQA